MFTYLKLKNFKSFENITFNLCDKSNRPKRLVLLYGENSMGKSNIVSAFNFLGESLRTMELKDMVDSLLSDESKINENTIRMLKDQTDRIGWLIKENKLIGSEDNMVLEFGFLLNGKRGVYTIETNNKMIVSERLEYVINKNVGTLFELGDKTEINPNLFLNKNMLNDIKIACSKYWGVHSFFSIFMHETKTMVKKYKNEQINENFYHVFNFFLTTSCKLSYSSYEHSYNSRVFASKGLSKLDKGKIALEDEYMLDNAESALTNLFKQIFNNIDKVFFKRKYDEKYVRYNLMVSRIIGEKARDVDFSSESSGTKSLIYQLPFILSTFDERASILDEFDNGLHDSLVKNIVESIKNNISGQLILTTHNTTLLNSNIPKNCLYEIIENDLGTKEINCLSDYKKLDNRYDIQSQYLNNELNPQKRRNSNTLIDFKDIYNLYNHRYI